MTYAVVSFAVGVIFGLGLSMSEMINPARVIGFLDVTGRWDPTLLFVMGGALAVTLVGFPFVLRRRSPLLADEFSLPQSRRVDRPLLVGAALFGIGWGLGGLCPGPAIAGLASGAWQVVLFVAMMIAGQWIGAQWTAQKNSRQS